MRLHFFNSAVIANSKLDYCFWDRFWGPDGQLLLNRPNCLKLSQSLCFRAKLSGKSLIWNGFFYFHANKTHFHNQGFALSLVLKVSVFGTRKWPIVFSIPKNGPRGLWEWSKLISVSFWFLKGRMQVDDLKLFWGQGCQINNVTDNDLW